MCKEISWVIVGVYTTIYGLGGILEGECSRFGEIERISRLRTCKNILNAFNQFGMKL